MQQYIWRISWVRILTWSCQETTVWKVSITCLVYRSNIKIYHSWKLIVKSDYYVSMDGIGHSNMNALLLQKYDHGVDFRDIFTVNFTLGDLIEFGIIRLSCGILFTLEKASLSYAWMCRYVVMCVHWKFSGVFPLCMMQYLWDTDLGWGDSASLNKMQLHYHGTNSTVKARVAWHIFLGSDNTMQSFPQWHNHKMVPKI